MVAESLKLRRAGASTAFGAGSLRAGSWHILEPDGTKLCHIAGIRDLCLLSEVSPDDRGVQSTVGFKQISI